MHRSSWTAIVWHECVIKDINADWNIKFLIPWVFKCWCNNAQNFFKARNQTWCTLEFSFSIRIFSQLKYCHRIDVLCLLCLNTIRSDWLWATTCRLISDLANCYAILQMISKIYQTLWSACVLLHCKFSFYKTAEQCFFSTLHSSIQARQIFEGTECIVLFLKCESMNIRKSFDVCIFYDVQKHTVRILFCVHRFVAWEILKKTHS